MPTAIAAMGLRPVGVLLVGRDPSRSRRAPQMSAGRYRPCLDGEGMDRLLSQRKCRMQAA